MASTRSKFNSNIFLIICLTSVDLIFYPHIADPFGSIKFWTILTLATCSILSILANKSSGVQSNDRKITNYFAILLLIFNLFQFVALANTPIFTVGLFGFQGRNLGFLYYFCLSIIAYYAFSITKRIKLNYLYRTAIALLCFFNFHGAAQHFGYDFIKLHKIDQYSPVILTVGNPNFAGALIGLLVILNIAYLLNCANNRVRVALAIQICISFLVILWTHALQGQLVSLVGISVIIYFKLKKNHPKLTMAWLGMILVGLFLLVIAFFNTGPLSHIIYKSSTIDRIYGWQAAISMFRTHPLFGVGLDSFSSYFMEYRNYKYPLMFGYGQSVNNAHNIFLQLLSTGGIFVAFIFCALILFTIWNGYKAIKNTSGENNYLIVGLFAFFISYVAQLFVSPDNPATSIWGWVFAGILVGNAKSTSNSATIKRNIGFQLSSLLIAVPLMICVLLTINQLFKNEYNFIRFVNIQNPSEPSLQEKYKEIAMSTFNQKWLDIEYKEKIAEKMALNGYANETLYFLKKILKEDPRNLNANIVSQVVYTNIGRVKEAVPFGETLQKIDPYGAENLLILAQNYLALGEKEKASRVIKSIEDMAKGTEVASKAAKLITK